MALVTVRLPIKSALTNPAVAHSGYANFVCAPEEAHRVVAVTYDGYKPVPPVGTWLCLGSGSNWYPPGY